MPKKIRAAVKRIGWGRLKRQFDNVISVTSGAVGIFADPARTGTIREKASEAIQRYIGVGLDGSVSGDAPFNNYMGVGTRLVEQHLLSRVGHYRRVSARRLGPMVSELIAPLLSWDAMGAATGAKGKLSAAHSCYVETISGYEPVSGEYLGIGSDKHRAQLIAYAGGEIVSRVSDAFPSVNQSLSKFTGGMIRGL